LTSEGRVCFTRGSIGQSAFFGYFLGKQKVTNATKDKSLLFEIHSSRYLPKYIIYSPITTYLNLYYKQKTESCLFRYLS